MDTTKQKIIDFSERARQEWAEEDMSALTPARTSNYHAILAGYAGVLEDEYGQLEKRKPVFMSELEDMAENKRLRVWDSSPEGQRYIELKSTLRAVDRVIAACKRRMERFNNEAFNRY